MTQALYAHMSNKTIKILKNFHIIEVLLIVINYPFKQCLTVSLFLQ
jgi:hypothetical protein